MAQVDGTRGYTRVINRFIELTDTVDFNELHQPFLKFMPASPSRVLDVGAGVGRDAAVFAAMGHNVVAVEPMADFLVAAKERHDSPRIEWLDDSLPMLAKLGDVCNQFHFVLASAVWHHIDDIERRIAIERLYQLLYPGGILALSLRNGPAGAGTHIFPTDSEKTIHIAELYGFETVLNLPSQPSLIKGKDDVVWAKLAFRRLQ